MAWLRLLANVPAPPSSRSGFPSGEEVNRHEDRRSRFDPLLAAPRQRLQLPLSPRGAGRLVIDHSVTEELDRLEDEVRRAVVPLGLQRHEDPAVRHDVEAPRRGAWAWQHKV